VQTSETWTFDRKQSTEARKKRCFASARVITTRIDRRLYAEVRRCRKNVFISSICPSWGPVL